MKDLSESPMIYSNFGIHGTTPKPLNLHVEGSVPENNEKPWVNLEEDLEEERIVLQRIFNRKTTD